MNTPAKENQHVVVVGGGIIGASIAWHLVDRGVAVTLVAPDIGGTATPNSFAWLNASWGNPKYYYELRRRSMGRWAKLVGEVPGLDKLVRWSGCLQWNLEQDELKQYESNHSSWGYDVRRVERDEIAKREPFLADAMVPEWALLLSEEGSVEPTLAAKLFVVHAHERGGLRVVSSKVTGFIKQGERIGGVVLRSGEQISADHVVLAAGLGSVPLCASVGIDLPVKGRAGLLAHSKPISKRLINGILVSSGPHVRQTVEGRILAGSNFAGGNPGEDFQATAEELFVKVKDMFKLDASEADLIQLDYYTIGYRPDPEDGFPILGASGLEGLTLAVMHSGVTLAAIVGDVLSDEVANGKKDPALGDFALSRFKKT